MTILPEEIYRFNAILIKIPAQFFTDLERTILSFIWKHIHTCTHTCMHTYMHKQEQKAKTIMTNKGTAGGVTITNFKLYYSY